MFNSLYQTAITNGVEEEFLKYLPSFDLIEGLIGYDKETILYYAWKAIRYFCFLVEEKYKAEVLRIESLIPKYKFVNHRHFNVKEYDWQKIKEKIIEMLDKIILNRKPLGQFISFDERNKYVSILPYRFGVSIALTRQRRKDKGGANA